MDDVCTSTSLFPGRRDGALSLRDDPRHICLSHSGTLTALAVAEVPVGLDIESAKAHPFSEAIVRRFFPEALQQRVFDAPDAERDRVFLECWTQLEAAAKLDGRGLTAPRGAFADLLACCDIATTWQGDLCVSIATWKEA